MKDHEITQAADLLWKLWKQLETRNALKRGLIQGMLEGGVEAFLKLGIRITCTPAGVSWSRVSIQKVPRITDRAHEQVPAALGAQGTSPSAS